MRRLENIRGVWYEIDETGKREPVVLSSEDLAASEREADEKTDGNTRPD